MIINLFSLPISKVNLLDSGIDFDNLKSVLEPLFEQAKTNNVDLEKQGGVSTYNIDSHLNLREEFKVLNSLIMAHAALYWKVLDVSENLQPVINQCWANKHLDNGFTSNHSHSLMPMVGTFYLEAPENSGDIVFINPMEYGLTHIPYNGPIEDKIETAVHIKTGDLVFFPGWIRHKTQENLSGNPRIVISFNIHYQGTYLNSNSEYPDAYTNHNSQIDILTNKIYRQQVIIEQLTRGHHGNI